jgi:hypothetical protein
MASESIKEFLVSLGFKVDENGLKKFNNGIASATKEALGTAAAVTVAVGAIDAFVTDVARGFDKLYFATKRTGSTTNEIRGLGFAFSQVGSSVEDAQSAIDALTLFKKSKLGAENWLVENLGVDPKSVGNSVKETLDIIRKFKSESSQQAIAQGGVIGWSPQQVITMQMMDIDGYFGKYQQYVEDAGLDSKKLTEQTQEYNRQIDETKTRFALLGDVIESKLIAPVEHLNEILNNLIKQSTSNAAPKTQSSEFLGQGIGNYIEKEGLGSFIIEAGKRGASALWSTLKGGAQLAAIGGEWALGSKGAEQKDIDWWVKEHLGEEYTPAEYRPLSWDFANSKQNVDSIVNPPHIGANAQDVLQLFPSDESGEAAARKEINQNNYITINSPTGSASDISKATIDSITSVNRNLSNVVK